MTKKFLIGFTALFSIFLFIFIPGVKAEEFTYTYHDRNYIFHDTGIDEYIENVSYDTINQVFYNKYGHYIEDDDYVDSFFLYYSNDDKINSQLFFFKSSEFSIEGQKTSGISISFYYDSNYGNNQVSMSLKSNVDNKADYMYFKNVDLDLSKYTYSGHGSTTSDVTTSFVLHNLTRNSTEDVNIYYYTNANVPIRDSTHIVGYTNKDSIGPKSYEFNEDINSLKYSKVEFKFDIPNNMEKELNINYDFHLITDDNTLDNSHTFKNPYFSERFTSCTVDENGAGSCSPFEKLNQFVIVESEKSCDLNSFNSGGCYGIFDYSKLEDNTINVSNLYKINNYNFIFNADILNRITNSFVLTLDLTFNTDVIVNSYLKSSLPFEVIYYERDFSGGSSSIDYYSTIDMTGKYGALFAPKLDTSKDDLTIRTLFKGEGHLDIQHRSSYNNVGYDILSSYSLNYCNEYLSNQSKIPYSCNIINGEFEFYLSNGNLEQALFFVNADYENDLNAEVYITYDTRYYEYYIFATPTDIVAVINPNTDEKYFISLEEFYNYADVDAGFIESIVGKFVDWFYERIPAVNQFKQIISLFTYNEYYNEAPTFEVSLSAIGIEQTVQIVDFSVFDEYRSTVIFWEMLVITTYTVIKVIDNVVSAFKGGK